MAETRRADSALNARREPRPRPRRSYTWADIIALMIFLASWAAYLAVVAAVGWLLFLTGVWHTMAACARFCVKVVALTLSHESSSHKKISAAARRRPATKAALRPLSPSGLETPAHGQSETHSQHGNVLEPSSVQPLQQKAVATTDSAAVADPTSSDKCAAAASDALTDLVAASAIVDLSRQEHKSLECKCLEEKASETLPDYMMDWEQHQVVAASPTDSSPSETADAEVRQVASQGTTSCEAAETAGVRGDAAWIEARSSAADVAVVAHDSNTPSSVAEGSDRQPAVDAKNGRLSAKKKKNKGKCRETPLHGNVLGPAALKANAEADRISAELLQQVEKEKAAEAKAAERAKARKNRKGKGKVKQAPSSTPDAPECLTDVPPAAEDVGLHNTSRDSGCDDTVRTADGADPPGSVDSASKVEALRQDWAVLLEQAAGCTDAGQQPIMLDRVSDMMQHCSDAGISVKYGRKVLQRLQAVAPAREALQSALSSKACTYEELDAALTAAKGCRSLIESDLVQNAQNKMAKLIRERVAPKQQQQAQQQHDQQQAAKVQQQQQARQQGKLQQQQQQRRQAGQQLQIHGPVGRAVPTVERLTYPGSAARAHSSTAGPGRRGQALACGCPGLINLGNTCYMNSMLQCINCCPDLAQLRSSAAAAGVQWHSAAAVGPVLVDLMTKMSVHHTSLSSQEAISPHQFKQAMAAVDDRWGGYEQQDSQEFLRSLLAVLQDECNRVKVKPKYQELSRVGTEAQQAAEAVACARSWQDSFINDLFGGLLQSTVTCSNCKHEIHCFEPSLDLLVPIPDNKKVSLQDCLEALAEGENLTGSDKIRCRVCNKTCHATKRLRVYSYPKLLVLSLKRFSSCGKGSNNNTGFGKNYTPVVIDGNQPLDLTPCCSSTGLKAAAGKGCGPPRYELRAMCEHHGGLGNGHYSVQGRSVADGHWYHFNDASVTASSCPSGSSRDAYVLFYRLLDS